MRTFSFERASAVAIVCFIVVGTFVALYSLVSTQPFGHDEAVYLAKARSWTEGTPANQWGVYRPIGMAAIAWLMLQFDTAETSVRMFGVLFGALTPAAVFLFFRRSANIWVATAAASIVATSLLLLQQAPQFLNDIPSSAMLVMALWLLYSHYESEGKSNSIYLVAPLMAAAFYLRYGVVSALIMIVVFTYFLLLQSFLRQTNPQFEKVGKTILIAIALFIPHFIHALVRTKSLFGILGSAEDAAHRAYLGEGLVQYIKWLPAEIGGWPIGIAAIAGALTAVVLISITRLRHGYVGLAWAGSIGLSTFILTGLLVHAEQRYVFFPLVLLSGTGIAFLYYSLEYLSPFLAKASMVLIVIATLYFGFHDYHSVQAYIHARENVPATLAYSKAHEAIRTDTGGVPCALWLAQFLPRASWYTTCSVYRVSDTTRFSSNRAAHAEENQYNIVFTPLREPQLTEAEASKFGITLTEIFRIRNLPGDMIVYRIGNAQFSAVIATTSLANPLATSSPLR